MTGDIGQDSGSAGLAEVIGRLSQLGVRTSLTVLDAALHLLDEAETDRAGAAAEMGMVARRVLEASRNLALTLPVRRAPDGR